MPKSKKLVPTEDFVAPEAPKQISKFDLDLGREDLNRLVAKVNEVIEKVNE